MNNPLSEMFSRIARWAAHQCGRASTFGLAVMLVLAWAVTGPAFHYSDTWQLVINTGTTIVTFLMVFLLQHAQNRDSTSIQLKLDELIRTNELARNQLLTLEDLTEAELEHIKAAFAVAASTGERDPVTEALRQAERDLSGRPAAAEAPGVGA